MLEPFELGAFAFEPDDLERDDFGFDAFDFALLAGFAVFADFGLALFVFAFDFDWLLEGARFDWALGFDFDCDFELGDFALLEPALFGAERFFVLVSAISLSPRGCPY